MMAGRGISVGLVTPAGTSEKELLRELDRRWATPPARLDTPLYDALSRAAKKTYPGVVFTPALFEAGTSLRAWRDRNIPGYGVYPYVISNEQLISMHGTNERIYVDALRRGTQFMYEMFSHFRS